MAERDLWRQVEEEERKKKNTIVNFMTKIHANRHADTRTDWHSYTLIH